MKSLMCLNILVVLGVAVTANNVTWTLYAPYERFLYNENIWRQPRRMVQTCYANYPKKDLMYIVTLSRIVAWDWGGRDNFGYATVVKGGPARRFCSIRLKSQWGKPMNWTIQYMGLPTGPDPWGNEMQY